MFTAGSIRDFAAGGVHFTFDRKGNKLQINAYLAPYETSARADMTPNQFIHYTHNWVRDLFAQLSVDLRDGGMHSRELPKEDGIFAALETDCMNEKQHKQIACVLVQKTHAITGAQAKQFGLPGGLLLNIILHKHPPSVQIQSLGIAKSQDEELLEEAESKAYRQFVRIEKRIYDRVEPHFKGRFSKRVDGMAAMTWELNNPDDFEVFVRSIEGAITDYALEQKIKSQQIGKA